MERIIAYLFIISLLASCNPPGNNSVDNSAAVEKSNEAETASSSIKVNLVDIDTDEALVSTALMAAPEGSRDGCTVIGYNIKGEFVTLREGTNELICLADNPNKKGFNAACYHKSLEPFMARGRALRAAGKTKKEIFDIREEEAKAGKLDMGATGSTLHILYGPNTKYDQETGKIDGAIYRYVIYVPWETSESTGLPETPVSANHPWIMHPGTHGAHIMISPINEEEGS